MFEYVGAIHIHSTYSDGTGHIPDIARLAGEVGLDFIMMTDHNTLKPKRDGFERWYGNVMCLIGYEINDRNDKNHYLAFGLDHTVGVRIPAEEYVRRVRERGGVGFIAHPDEQRSSMPQHPPYPWLAWDATQYDGIEIWNHMSEWAEGLTEENKFQRFIHPLKSIDAPRAVTLRRWDELSRTRRVAGIGGVDAHAHKANLLGFFDVEVFPYKVMFRSIHTHVLLDQPLRANDNAHFEEDKWNIFRALQSGRSFIGNAYHADPKGFRFFAIAGQDPVQMGGYIPAERVSDTQLFVTTPDAAHIRLLCDGRTVRETVASHVSWKPEQPGAYRVEARLEKKAWIYSNHIRIGVGNEE